ncbi:cytochrome b5-like heme/steroid binding domain-containing protein [Obelidium mucronatum]|nr:cytochrome b5-like heme/steroid binding domain-containing protein [Obelidium mucronatum]
MAQARKVDFSLDESSSDASETSDVSDNEMSRPSNVNQFPMRGSPQIAGGSSGRQQVGVARKKVPLGVGHSSMDWSRLKTSGADLRGGITALQRYTPSEIAQHNSKDDLWMAFQGKVYCCTHYLAFHPGGVGQLMRGAGKDATDLFMKVHPWVNLDYILSDKCLIGYLIPESMKQQPLPAKVPILDLNKPGDALNPSAVPGRSKIPTSGITSSTPRKELDRSNVASSPIQFKMFAPKVPLQEQHASKTVEENFGKDTE